MAISSTLPVDSSELILPEQDDFKRVTNVWTSASKNYGWNCIYSDWISSWISLPTISSDSLPFTFIYDTEPFPYYRLLSSL